jgi:hypothetical protein
MTIDSRPGPHLVDLLRRLRARPVSSWGVGDRDSVMRAALQRLAELAADACGDQRRVVPDAGIVALPDQLAVLVADAQSSEVPPAELDAVLTDLARALSV